MKKLFALILALTLVFSLLSGCGSETAASSAAETPSSGSSAVVEAPVDTPEASVPEVASVPEEPAYFPLDEAEELSVWYMTIPMYGSLAETPADFPYLIEAQKRLNLNLTFDCAAIMDAGENFSLMIASGDYNDMICMFSRYYTGTLDEAIDNDILYDLTEDAEAWLPDYNAARSEDRSIQKLSETNEGRLALVCPITTVDGQVGAGGPMIRNDWLEALKLESPVTIDEYTSVLTAMKNEFGGTFALPASGITSFNFINDAFDIKLPYGTTGDAWYHVDGQVKWGGFEEGYREYLELMHSWYENGLISSDFTSDSDSANSGITTNDYIGSGAISMFFGRTANLSVYDELISGEGSVAAVSDMKKTPDQVTHFKAPKLKIGAGWGISTNCANPELAARFLNWWWTEEGFTLANYGIENETYVVNDDGSFSFTDLVLKDPENPVTTTMTVYTADAGNIPCLVDSSRNYQINDERTMNANALWTENDDGAYLIDATVAQLLTTDEYEEFSGLFSDIQTTFSENCLKFITGDRSLDEFDDYIAQIEASGMARCIELVQTGYDRFISK